MNEHDAMTLLVTANPVRQQDLEPLVLPKRFARRIPNRRIGIAAAIAVGVAAALAGVFAFSGSSSGQSLGNTPRHHVVLGLTGAAGATGGTSREGPVRGGATGSTGTSGRTGSVGPGSEGPGFSVGFLHRSDGALESFGVSVWEFQKTGFQIEVRYLGPRGDYLQGGYPVVYRRTVPAASMSSTSGSVGVGPSGRTGPGPTAWTWSGRFTPSDWNGGCRSGDYEIDLDYGAAGPFSNDASSDSFRCTGN